MKKIILITLSFFIFSTYSCDNSEEENPEKRSPREFFVGNYDVTLKTYAVPIGTYLEPVQYGPNRPFTLKIDGLPLSTENDFSIFLDGDWFCNLTAKDETNDSLNFDIDYENRNDGSETYVFNGEKFWPNLITQGYSGYYNTTTGFIQVCIRKYNFKSLNFPTDRGYDIIILIEGYQTSIWLDN